MSVSICSGCGKQAHKCTCKSNNPDQLLKKMNCPEKKFNCPEFGINQCSNPFSNEEKKIWDLLVAAHNTFVEMTAHNHFATPEENDYNVQQVNQWVDRIHALQDLLIVRIVRREYPTIFR